MSEHKYLAAVENPSVRAMAKIWLQLLPAVTEEQAARFAQYIAHHPHGHYTFLDVPRFALRGALEYADIAWRRKDFPPDTTSSSIARETGRVFINGKLVFDPLPEEEGVMADYKEALDLYNFDADPTKWWSLVKYCRLLEAATAAGIKQEDLPDAPFPVELADTIQEVVHCNDCYYATLRSCEGCGTSANSVIQQSYDNMVAAHRALPDSIAQMVKLPRLELICVDIKRDAAARMRDFVGMVDRKLKRCDVCMPLCEGCKLRLDDTIKQCLELSGDELLLAYLVNEMV